MHTAKQQDSLPPASGSSTDEAPRSTRHLNIRYTDRLLASAEMLLRVRDPQASSQQDTLALIADLIHAATHDVLTGMPTRSLLLSRLEHELAQVAVGSEQVGLLFVDLDNFKLVNDTLGHDSGDELLCEVSRRLQECVRPSVGSIVSRVGGDEFVILYPQATIASEDLLAARILDALTQPVPLAGREVVTSASIGVASCAAGALTAEELMQNADIALYSAKAGGRNRVVRFNDELQARASRRLQIEADLRVALRDEQFSLQFQPQVSLVTGRLVGVEALVRWHHRTYGNLSPLEFIPIAEDSRLIGELGRQVLRSACQQLAAWALAMPACPLTLTVNVSPRQLGDPTFISEVETILRQTGIRHASLCLDLTESALTNQDPEILASLHRLHAMGIYVAFDDFATESSALARLRDLPIEVLKIDKSFIDGLASEPGDTAVVSSILSLAFATGKHVIAEGIERLEQALALRSMGCHVAQGYLFSKPVDADLIVGLMDRPLWQAPVSWSAQTGTAAAATPSRQAHPTFIEEFLDHIGVPMGVKLGSAP